MKIQFCAVDGASKPVDLLGIVCFEDQKHFFREVSKLDSYTKEKLQKILSQKKFAGKSNDTFFVPTPFIKTVGAILLLGVGKKESFTTEKARRLTARLLAHAKSFQYEKVCLDIDSFSDIFTKSELASACTEGARLSDYQFTKYKSKTPPAKKVTELDLCSKDSRDKKEILKAIHEAEIISDGVIFTRNLANEPANIMTPEYLAKQAKQMAKENNLNCEVLGLKQIQALKMGGILGVSQGSSFPPQLIILENKVPKPIFENPIVLVGKGITFDTGGISIKPSADMDKMKFDMCGAAAVIGAMKAIANLKLPVRVIGITPVCENMPGSKAQRPGDIITISNGKTVEVLNTDAEGRLILADALSYAKRFKPKALVDIATLTGACSAFFSDQASGLMGTDESLLKRIQGAGERTGERCWPLPLWEEYADLIRATYADIQNISRKNAGTITAGLFLKEFADHTKEWAHLDVAGTAWADSVKPLSAIGATGVGVRLFVELIKSYLE